MIVNILRFGFKDGTTDKKKAEALGAMRRTAAVESVSFATVGQDLGDPTEGYTHAYCVGIEDLPALERYMYDPVHLEGDFGILPHLARLSAVRLSDDMDPEVGDRVTEIFLAKVAKYPEWGELLSSIPDTRISTG